MAKPCTPVSYTHLILRGSLQLSYTLLKSLKWRENAQRELYVSWETAVQRAMARYEVIIDNYRSGKYPKRDRFGDEFFKTQGGLMEAFGGKDLKSTSLSEMDAIWDEAKKQF